MVITSRSAIVTCEIGSGSRQGGRSREEKQGTWPDSAKSLSKDPEAAGFGSRGDHSSPESLTLNSSFQRRSSRVLRHQRSSVPTSVTWA